MAVLCVLTLHMYPDIYKTHRYFSVFTLDTVMSPLMSDASVVTTYDHFIAMIKGTMLVALQL